MVCSVIVILIMSVMDGTKQFSLVPARNFDDAAKISHLIEQPNYKSAFLQKGIVDVKVHDVVKSKPFKCGD